MIAAIAAATAFGSVSTAQADSPWMDTTNGAGSGKWWTDPGGSATDEEIAVCDNADDGMGVIAMAFGDDSYFYVKDSLDNGKCPSVTADLFPEGESIDFYVCLFYGHVYEEGDALVDCAYDNVTS
ncbi:hypothetical protein [Streptomyces sp. NPDC048277]|uniref:hypothetical protein n=1 Tax=Streptomyces sp. NPDC048277 TaxID=3155027 RepID=UPI00340D5249